MASIAKSAVSQSQNSLPYVNPAEPHTFIIPTKRINEGHDVSRFLTSQAYRDIRIFIMQLNLAMCPRKSPDSSKISTWPLDSNIELGGPVKRLQELLQRIASIIDEAPPDPGPRRFGNVSFRKWFEILESRAEELLKSTLSERVLGFSTTSGSPDALMELTPYLLGAFGSSQRLDYGTGHELSFMAFLGCLWKLVVIGVIEPYLRVVRRLILTYTLEPAGSHGVWGLDDHSFVSYILALLSFAPPIGSNEAMPEFGALPGSPKPGDIAKKNVVDEERQHNMYFSAIGFINDVKTGPFWEHSRQLYDISGVRDGWGKINKGMIKMYNGEVLSKFPVVQHFPFGSLFSWEQDPQAISTPSSVHTSSQPQRLDKPTTDGTAQEHTKAPWANTSAAPQQIPTQAPWAQSTILPSRAEPPTRAPWASTSREPVGRPGAPNRLPDGPTVAPWAKRTEK